MKMTWAEYKAWLDAMHKELRTVREQGRFGYDPKRAREISATLELEPGYELAGAHCGCHPDAHAWGVRVVRNGLPAAKIDRLKQLQPGPHGGIVASH